MGGSIVKEPNVLQKFRAFWSLLDGIEREDLWDILTALRGPDPPNSENMHNGIKYDVLKSFTTCRIRGELLPYHGVILKHWLIAKTLDEIQFCNGGEKLPSPKKQKELFKNAPGHFFYHVQAAIRAILKYQPTSARDLKKFLNVSKE